MPENTKVWKKMKVLIGKSKATNGSVVNIKSKKTSSSEGRKTGRSGYKPVDDISGSGNGEVMSGKSGRKKLPKLEEDGRMKHMCSGGKRKRTYASEDMDEEGALDANMGLHNRKSLSKLGRNKIKVDTRTGKRRENTDHDVSGQFNRRGSLSRGWKSQESDFESLNEKKTRAKSKTLIKGNSSGDADMGLNNRKSLSKLSRNKIKVDTHMGKQRENTDHDVSGQFSRRGSLSGGRKSQESEFLNEKKSRPKSKAVIRGKSSGDYGNANNISEVRTNSNKKENEQKAEPLKKYLKKKAKYKTGLADDADVMERPKKKKKGIRIDPHDISNKRMDDGISMNDNNKQNKGDVEQRNDAKMSKNAQFRAIRPSPSILSYVEENLLGRRREIELRRAGYNVELSAPLDNIPLSTSSERERIEEPVFRNKLAFFAAAKISSSFPPPDIPEIAFAGRSNVGKSSLLNALTRQWGVVRTSDKPGLTQSINFFKLAEKLCLVDLPGYGFAYAKEDVKEAWEELVKEYVSTRIGLKRVCLLIDTKWGMKARDYELVELMERYQTKYQIILTKTDTVFPIDVARRAMQIEENLKTNKSVVQPLIMVSSKSGAGIRSFRTVLAKIARFAKL